MGKGFDTFMENPYWRQIYEEAPSERLKEYYRLRYDLSRFVNGDEYRNEEAEEALKELILYKNDIQYIQRFSGSGMARHYCEGAIQKLSGEFECYGFPAAAFRVEEWNPWYNADLNSR